MRIHSKVAVAAAVLAVAGGGAAYAATQRPADPTPSSQQSAFLQDAAKRLGVTQAALTDALKGAAVDQVDAAVAAGRLTSAQGDAIKAAIKAGRFPFGGPGIGFGHGPGPGPGGGALHPFGIFDAAAAYLGLTDAQLQAQVRSGKTFAQIATAAGKSVDGLESAIVASVKKQLDAAVA